MEALLLPSNSRFSFCSGSRSLTRYPLKDMHQFRFGKVVQSHMAGEDRQVLAAGDDPYHKMAKLVTLDITGTCIKVTRSVGYHYVSHFN